MNVVNRSFQESLRDNVECPLGDQGGMCGSTGVFGASRSDRAPVHSSQASFRHPNTNVSRVGHRKNRTQTGVSNRPHTVHSHPLRKPPLETEEAKRRRKKSEANRFMQTASLKSIKWAKVQRDNLDKTKKVRNFVMTGGGFDEPLVDRRPGTTNPNTFGSLKIERFEKVNLIDAEPRKEFVEPGAQLHKPPGAKKNQFDHVYSHIEGATYEKLTARTRFSTTSDLMRNKLEKDINYISKARMKSVEDKRLGRMRLNGKRMVGHVKSEDKVKHLAEKKHLNGRRKDRARYDSWAEDYKRTNMAPQKEFGQSLAVGVFSPMNRNNPARLHEQLTNTCNN